MKKVVFVCLCLAVLASCVEKSKYIELQQENELLKAEKEQSATELDETLSTLNEIQESIASVREAEDYLHIRQSGEITPTVKEQIKSNILLIVETLKKNKEQLTQLQDKLNSSDLRSKELQKSINLLNADINRKTEMILALQEELTRKDIRIRELDETVADLMENVDALTESTIEQSEQLDKQDKELNRAYYCYGTRKELKEQNILTGGGLFSQPKALQKTFNKDYFVAIDKRSVKEIPLFDRKAVVRTNHPQSSYELKKDKDNNITLVILDTEQFWSVSDYLVIEVG